MALTELQKLKKLELEIYESVMAGIAKVSDEAMVHAQNQVEAVKKELAEIEAQLPPAPVEPVSPPAEEPPAAPADAGNAAPDATAGTASTDAGAAPDAGGATEDPPVDGASSK